MGIITVKPTEENVRFLGRYLKYGTPENDDYAVYLSFSASSVDFRTNADEVEAEFVTDDLRKEENSRAYVGIFIDNDDEPYMRFALTDERKTYKIFNRDEYNAAKREEAEKYYIKNGIHMKLHEHLMHKIQIAKMSEAAFGSVGVAKIMLSRERRIEMRRTNPHRHLVQFVGDSITCGYGNETALATDSFSTGTENPFKAYAVMACRKVDFDYELVSWSGIGARSSWTDSGKLNDTVLMKDIYPYADKVISDRKKIKPEEWHPLKKPDIIFINLGTNDYSYTKVSEERNAEFEKAYLELIRMVYEKNPHARIICALGIMGQELCPQIADAVEKAKNEMGILRITSLVLPVQRDEDGRAADFHPTIKTHERASERVARVIAYESIV